ncbi:MAG: NTP transferase domain-containing protein [Clostridiales bacterium]|nr:NTP transferase domain-containing protein [Clostridiales bacterium]
MKAIIMAGGEGKRLRPLSADKPKPMVELLDRPALEHILELLVKNGVAEACLTLKYLPQIITDYFGNGEKFGVRLDSRIETEALGTAGGVLNCADFIGNDDFLVISGDCVCDFDLRALIEFHRRNRADVTLALYSHEEPCEYGLVVTDGVGRIVRFIEKPAWDRVLTDRINTGIYVISPHILGEIPKGTAYDFGRDLFPKLLREGRRMYGFNAEGYWCDIGSTGAYHQCCLDALRGRIKIDLRAPMADNGIWCASQLPGDAVLIPPVYIGRNAVIGSGAVIGPLTVIGASSVIGAGAVVSRSVVNGAAISENADLDGAVLCSGVTVGRSVSLQEGSVIGSGCVIGDGSVISAGAKIWPGRQLAPDSVISGIITQENRGGGLSFMTPGILSGEPGIAVTADACLRLGEGAGEYGRVGVGWCGGETARVMAEAFGCGVCTAGGELVRYDGGFPSCAAYAGLLFDLPLTVFFEEKKNHITIAFFGKNGGIIPRDAERKLEMTLLEARQTSLLQTGRASAVSGVCEAYVAAAARQAYAMMENTGGLTVAVAGGGAENRALKNALQLMNCTVTAGKAGAPSFEVTCGGRALAATDEEGYRLSDDRLRVMTAFVEFACGTAELAVPYEAPVAIDKLAQYFNAAVLRAGRDGQRAEELYQHQMIMRDGVFAGARLCAWLKSRGEPLSSLRRRIPEFSSMTREVSLKKGRGAAMRLMSSYGAGMAADLAAGLRLSTDRGCVYISPLREKSALKIHAESFNEETAEELCTEFERRALEVDHH